MALRLQKLSPRDSRSSAIRSASWTTREKPGVVISLHHYIKTTSPLAPADGWRFQGLFGEEHREDRQWLKDSGLLGQVFPTRREALQALEMALLLAEAEKEKVDED